MSVNQVVSTASELAIFLLGLDELDDEITSGVAVLFVALASESKL